ncbi:MAG: hypothetical protein JXB30_05805 [Anaerolineae bacterium]|nr:hypothetical protein [Anaerolineae bacterium]
MAGLEHVQIDADMGILKPLPVESGFPYSLDTNENDSFHMLVNDAFQQHGKYWQSNVQYYTGGRQRAQNTQRLPFAAGCFEAQNPMSAAVWVGTLRLLV